MLSALFNPSFCLCWLDHDVLAPDDMNDVLKEMGHSDIVTAEMERVQLPESRSGENKQVPKAKSF